MESPVYQCLACKTVFMTPGLMELEGEIFIDVCPALCGADMTETKVMVDYEEIHWFWAIVHNSMDPTEVNRLRLIAQTHMNP